MDELDFYQLLGVAPDAEPEVIEAAYRALMKKHHPDHRGGADDDRAKEINRAYSVLGDPDKRSGYDSERATTVARRHLVGRSVPPDPPPPAQPSPRRTDRQEAVAEQIDGYKRHDGPRCPRCQCYSPRTARFCDYCGFKLGEELWIPHQAPPQVIVKRRTSWTMSFVTAVALIAAAGILLAILGSIRRNGAEANASRAENTPDLPAPGTNSEIAGGEPYSENMPDDGLDPAEISPEERRRAMLSSSPQRELASEWFECVRTGTNALLMQGGSLEQFDVVVLVGCSQPLFRLRTALIQEFGADAADGLINEIRTEVRNAYARALASLQPSQNRASPPASQQSFPPGTLRSPPNIPPGALNPPPDEPANVAGM
jgi:hypothetical protein